MHSRDPAPADETQRLRHALRTPLGTITLSVDLLRMTATGPEEQVALDAIARAVAEITEALAG
jgi:hypothetical protein